MLYRKEGNTYSKVAAINAILVELGSVVQPAYIDDDTLSLYGFELIITDNNYVQKKVEREAALASVDWISNAKYLTKETKDAVEAWRSVVRDCPNCITLPPLPELVAIKIEATILTNIQLDKIKNYVTKDVGWLLFLQTWKDLEFTNSKNVLTNLFIAYTKVKLDEVIGSI